MAQIHQIREDLHVISTFNEAVGISFNQYLIFDRQPTLIHTGSAPLFQETLAAVRTIVDPPSLRYAFVSHFEADECGALAAFVEVAPELQTVCSAVTSRQLAGFGIRQNALVMKDGETLALGRRRLRFVAYPSEMHLWEGLLAFEETEGILFTSDLFISPGNWSSPVTKADAESALVIAQAAIPWDEGRNACLARIKALSPQFLALGHGPVLDLRS